MNHSLAPHLDASGDRPVWAVLDAAAATSFSGRITLHLPTPLQVHIERGFVYEASRPVDPPIAERLVALGVVDRAQLDCGTVHLGGVSHLGRLFERVPELDRDVVELALEMATEAILGPFNDTVVPSITVEHRAHHPSGVVRWYREISRAPLALEPATTEPVPARAAAGVEPAGQAATVPDPGPSWLASLEHVSLADDPRPHAPEIVPAPVVHAPTLGRPSIPAPPAAPIHDLMADLDLAGILAKVASPDGPPITERWADEVPAVAAFDIDLEVRSAVTAALAGIESATRRDEVVDQYVARVAPPSPPVAAAPPPPPIAPVTADEVPTPSLPLAVPTLAVPTLAAPSLAAPLTVVAPPVPGPAAPAAPAPSTPTVPWPYATDTGESQPSPITTETEAVTDDATPRSGGFRRLIGGARS